MLDQILTEAEKEVSRTKCQLQQYMQEVERVEELLLRKEKEREEMLEHFRSLSQGAVILEDTNTSLEAEAAETKWVIQLRRVSIDHLLIFSLVDRLSKRAEYRLRTFL